jgi:hypothetical protein
MTMLFGGPCSLWGRRLPAPLLDSEAMPSSLTVFHIGQLFAYWAIDYFGQMLTLGTLGKLQNYVAQF